MDISATMAAGEKYLGADASPEGFEAYWRARAEACAGTFCAPDGAPALADAGFRAPRASYYLATFCAADGTPLRARVAVPKAPGPHPCIVTWHDAGRGPRGWFHLSRYVAAGYAVFHPAYRALPLDLFAGCQEGPGSMAAARLAEDAVSAALAAARVPGVDPGRLLAHGEGLGALPALAAAALAPGVRACAVLNAMPADIRGAWEQGAGGPVFGAVSRHFRERDPAAESADAYFGALAYADAANFAALLPEQARLLDGICLMDEAAPPLTQYAAYNRAPCAKELARYPKYGHERLNDFENRLLSFMHFGERDA